MKFSDYLSLPDSELYFKDVQENQENDVIKSVNRIKSTKLFFEIHLSNFATKDNPPNAALFLPFCNQFRGSGKTRFSGILSDKEYLEKNMNDIVESFSLYGNMSPEHLKKNSLFVEKLLGSNYVFDKLKFVEDILKRIFNLLELKRHVFKPELAEGIIENLKSSAIKETETMKRFSKVVIWHIDEVNDHQKFREIWDTCYMLYLNNYYRNSETLYLFYFSGPMAFDGLFKSFF